MEKHVAGAWPVWTAWPRALPTGKCQAGGQAPSRLDAEVHEKKGVIRCRVAWPRFPFPSCLQKPIPTDSSRLPFRASSRRVGSR